MIFGRPPPRKAGKITPNLGVPTQAGLGQFQQPLNEQHQKLFNLVSKSEHILLKVASVFPFDLFPDSLIIDENKVTFCHKEFFKTAEIHPVLIEDITDVLVDTGPFFASLKVIDSSNERFPVTLTVGFLKNTTALQAQKIIQGLIAAKKQGIDFCQFDTEELKQQLERLGETS